jgi:MFS family permease
MCEFCARYRLVFPLILSLISVYFFSFFQRIGVPGMIFDEIQIDLGLTASGVALLGAAYLYIYGGMQFFVGIIADRYGFPRVFLLGGVVLAIGSVLFPLSHGTLLLYGTRFLIGLGSSLLFVCMAKAINHYFAPRHFGIMLSISQSLGFFGGLLGTYPLATLARSIGWRHALLLAGLVTVMATCILSWILYRGKLLGPQSAPPVVKHLVRTVFRMGELWKFALPNSISFGIYFVAQATIGKKLLSDCFHLPPGESAIFMFLMLSTCLVVTLLAGFLLKFCGYRYRPLMIASWAIVALSCLGMIIALSPSVHSLALTRICYLGMAVASFAGPIYTTATSMICSPSVMGTAIGFLNGAVYVVISLLANGSGVILDWYRQEAIRTPSAWIYPMEAFRLFFIVALGLMMMTLPALLAIKQKRASNSSSPPSRTRS